MDEHQLDIARMHELFDFDEAADPTESTLNIFSQSFDIPNTFDEPCDLDALAAEEPVDHYADTSAYVDLAAVIDFNAISSHETPQTSDEVAEASLKAVAEPNPTTTLPQTYDQMILKYTQFQEPISDEQAYENPSRSVSDLYNTPSPKMKVPTMVPQTPQSTSARKRTVSKTASKITAKSTPKVARPPKTPATTPSKRPAGRNSLIGSCSPIKKPRPSVAPPAGPIARLFGSASPPEQQRAMKQALLNIPATEGIRSVEQCLALQFAELSEVEKAQLLLPLINGEHPIQAEHNKQVHGDKYGAMRQRQALEKAFQLQQEAEMQ